MDPVMATTRADANYLPRGTMVHPSHKVDDPH
jgi:hypothetical protein